MKTYTGKDEEDMLLRYLSGLWLTDEEEFLLFKEELCLADTTAREMATMIEGTILRNLIDTNQYDKIEPSWLVEYKGLLQVSYSREQLLEVVQAVLFTQNDKGIEYMEDYQLLMHVWERYKN